MVCKLGLPDDTYIAWRPPHVRSVDNDEMRGSEPLDVACHVLRDCVTIEYQQTGTFWPGSPACSQVFGNEESRRIVTAKLGTDSKDGDALSS